MNTVLPLASVHVGMVLAEPASVAGNTLLAAGVTLTAAHLALLKERQVRSLVIADASKPAPLDPKLVLATDKVLRPRFRCTDLSHPALKEMYRLALLRQVRLGGLKPQGDAHGH